MGTWTEAGRIDFNKVIQVLTLSKDPGAPKAGQPPAWRCLSPRRGEAGAGAGGGQGWSRDKEAQKQAPTQLRPEGDSRHAEQGEQREGDTPLKAGSWGRAGEDSLGTGRLKQQERPSLRPRGAGPRLAQRTGPGAAVTPAGARVGGRGELWTGGSAVAAGGFPERS